MYNTCTVGDRTMHGFTASGVAQVMPTTFAELLAARNGVWLAAPAAEGANTRQSQAELSEQDQQRFIAAVEALNEPDQTGISAYGRLAAIHSDMRHNMHNMGDGSQASQLGQQRFLPWHRVYLHEFEQLLQSVDPTLTVPYWDWTAAQQQAISAWLTSFRPTINIPRPGPGRVRVTRAPGTLGFDLAAVVGGNVDSNAPALADVLQRSDYTEFATGLESIHDLVHVWVGGRRGTMSSLPTAPADPIFWMHHANIDRLWWQWHQSPSGQGQNPTLNPPDNIMDPWRFAEADTRDLATFGYTYA